MAVAKNKSIYNYGRLKQMTFWRCGLSISVRTRKLSERSVPHALIPLSFSTPTNKNKYIFPPQFPPVSFIILIHFATE
jgi:hypothetical protein